MNVRTLTAEHWPSVERIYAAGIATGHATFESEPPTWAQFDAGRLPEHRLVALDETLDDVVGWAAVSRVSDRCAYAGVVEHSVYVDPPRRAVASAGSCSTRSSSPPRRPASGPSNRASSRRTSPASSSTTRSGSATSASASASAG